MASIDNLTNEIMNELVRYTNLVEEEVEVAKEDVADQLVTELKETSPKKTGRYRKGWRTKKVGNKIVIHNKTHYRLTHLLEKGHAKAGGGRVPGQEHIRPAEERAIAEFISRVERAIGS